MSEAKRVYVVGSPEGALGTVVSALGEAAGVVTHQGDLQALAQEVPGVVLLDAQGMSATDLIETTGALSAEGWTVCVLTREETPRLRTVSFAGPDDLEDVRRHLADPASEPACLLDLNRVLVEIARVRHDVNNPLTAAMAEVQLLLMEAPDGEDKDSLEAVLQQLRRIRDMVAATRHLRPRRP